MSPPQGSLFEQRERIVRDHIEAENRGDLEGAMSTFSRPRYEYVNTDEVHVGVNAVLKHWRELERAFPDQQVEIVDVHHADDIVAVEAVARGSHTGPYRGLPPTAKRYELPFLGLFVFENSDLVCERVYVDTTTLLSQLGVARDPLSLAGRVATVVNHPVTVWRAAMRMAMGR